jgi:hypothetical protein
MTAVQHAINSRRLQIPSLDYVVSRAVQPTDLVRPPT